MRRFFNACVALVVPFFFAEAFTVSLKVGDALGFGLGTSADEELAAAPSPPALCLAMRSVHTVLFPVIIGLRVGPVWSSNVSLRLCEVFL